MLIDILLISFVSEEESIKFAPTYRYKRGSNEYIWEKVKRSGVILINVVLLLLDACHSNFSVNPCN